MRQIVLDTETTGLDPAEGHRIIEIGAIELVDRKLSGNRFHCYLDPEREIDPGAAEVHGLTSEFLSDKPKFADIAEDLQTFLNGAELIIHNAPFDVGFLNREFQHYTGGWTDIGDYCTVVDTLVLAKRKHPGQRNSLDALCKRYAVDNSHRELHGALLDAEILADVYLAMTGGQTLLALEAEPAADAWRAVRPAPNPSPGTGPETRPRLKVVRCTAAELAEHQRALAEIAAAHGGQCLWAENP